jgi:hypothetical protein
MLKARGYEDPKVRAAKEFLFFFFYSYVHTMFGSFLPPSPAPSLTSHPLPLPLYSLTIRNYFAFFSDFVEDGV